MIHLPSGVLVTAQCRSRQNSYAEAYEELKKRLDEKHQVVYNAVLAGDRKQQVGSGQRGDKIRTYRFQDDKVHDHVTGKSAKCSAVLKGNFDKLWG